MISPPIPLLLANSEQNFLKNCHRSRRESAWKLVRGVHAISVHVLYSSGYKTVNDEDVLNILDKNIGTLFYTRTLGHYFRQEH